MRIIVCGVAGSGKSTVGAALAGRLGARFTDGDSLHSEANVTKMADGRPLTDEDREPWLVAIVKAATADEHIVIACSALGRHHRDLLRSIEDVAFVFLDVEPATARTRVQQRVGHFMTTAMVASQFDALDRPTDEEADVLTVSASVDVDRIVTQVVARLS